VNPDRERLTTEMWAPIDLSVRNGELLAGRLGAGQGMRMLAAACLVVIEHSG